MDSEVDADIKTLSLPASTTISAFGRTLIDDAAAGNARTTLGLGSLATLSSVDISSNTNLVAGTNITLSGDTLSVDDAFLKNNANDTTSGTITAGGLISTGNISGSAASTGSFGMASVGKLVIRNDYSAAGWNITGDEISAANGLITLNNQGSTGVYIKNGIFAQGNYNVVQLTVRGNSSQTANIQEWTNSSNSVLASVTSGGNITTTGTVDGRDLQTDGTKLDGIEANADVTDTTNVN